MLWYKAWLETRWIFLLFVGLMLLAWLTPLWMPAFGFRLPPGVSASRIWLGVHMGSLFISYFVANALAGSGVNSQTAYGPMPGPDGSMLFTLSLPVSRRRLLFVRAGLGALLTSALVVVMAGYTLFQRPGGASAFQAIEYFVRVFLCTMAIYALAVLFSCLLEVWWLFMAQSFFWMTLLVLQFKFSVVAWLSPLRGMSLISYPITAPMPWAPLLASVTLAGVCMFASVLVLERKEY
jgi:hypothetical protein